MTTRPFESTCWSVVLSAAAGDLGAREEFAKRYEPVVRSYLSTRWRVASGHDRVSDGVQDVMIECLKPAGALSRLDRGRSADFRGYLYGITRRTAIAIERRARRDQRDSIFGGNSHRAQRRESTLSAAFDRTWAQVLSLEALTLLRSRIAARADRKLREACLEGRFVENKPPRVIAEELRVPVEDVYEIVKWAKAEFRGAIFEVIAQYHPGATRRELEDKCRELASRID